MPTSGEHGLGHEFRVLVRISAWEAADALLVPIGALFRYEGKWAVFRLAGAAAVLTVVEVGHRNAELAEVLAGLTPGERVVLHPSDRIYAGVRIKPRTAERLH